MKEGLALIVLAISLALTPSLVAADSRINIWTDKSAYRVGENWSGVSWDANVCSTEKGNAHPIGALTIEGPSVGSVSVRLPAEQYKTGSYTPSFGNPWVAADVGSWTLTINVNNSPGQCTASGKAAFRVSA